MTDRPTGGNRPRSPSVTLSERIRVALVGGSGAVASDDLYRLLRRRLLILTAIVSIFFSISFVLNIWHWWRVIAAGAFEQMGGYRSVMIDGLMNGVPLITALVSVALLWRHPPSFLSGLRAIELIVVGSLTALQLVGGMLPSTYGVLTRLPVEPVELRLALFQKYQLSQMLSWFVFLVLYGTIIPNTLRRCLIVVGSLALSPLALFAVFAFWLQPLPPLVATDFLIPLAITNAIAMATVVFSSSRIEILRQQAAKARMLGQYVLKDQLGAGGMGEVYRAEHLLLRRPCAIKLIRPERAGDPKNLRRFEREVQVTATLTHPNTIQIYDYGRADDGTFYYVMEYLPGLTLEQLVKQRGPLPPERAVHLLRQLCGALREAHAAGLIHRDIKPSNVIVCERGGLLDVAKLLDFGIVDTLSSDQGDEITAHGQLLGTPAYMSAEQAAAAPDLDARSDLYSLGATAYFTLTGKPPFDYPTINLTIAAQLRDAVTPPHYVRSGIPADLSAVIVQCLQKDPGLRYQDAAGLDRALAACACAGRWTEECAVQAAQDQPRGDEDQQLSTRELERRWGI